MSDEMVKVTRETKPRQGNKPPEREASVGGVIAHGASVATLVAAPVLLHVGGLGALDTAGMFVGGGSAAAYGTHKLVKKGRSRGKSSGTRTKRSTSRTTRSGMGGLGLAGRKRRKAGASTGAGASGRKGTGARKRLGLGLGAASKGKTPRVAGSRAAKRRNLLHPLGGGRKAATAGRGSVLARRGGKDSRRGLVRRGASNLMTRRSAARSRRASARSGNGGTSTRRGLFRRLNVRRNQAKANPSRVSHGFVRRSAHRAHRGVQWMHKGLNGARRNQRLPRLLRMVAGLALIPVALVALPVRSLVRRLAQRRAAQQEATYTVTQEESDSAKQVPALTRSRGAEPRTAGTTEGTITQGGKTTMSGHPIVDAWLEAGAAIASYEPENAKDLESFLKALESANQEQAGHFNTLADRMTDEMPIDTTVADSMREYGSAHSQLAEYGAAVHSAFRAAHEDELERLENPRPREEMWDKTQND